MRGIGVFVILPGASAGFVPAGVLKLKEVNDSPKRRKYTDRSRGALMLPKICAGA
jgi:hypothetical protein